MKKTGIFIDLRNKEHVAWWNNIASKLVKTVSYDTIVETATNKPVGVVFAIKGFLTNYVVKQNTKFLKDPITTVFELKD